MTLRRVPEDFVVEERLGAEFAGAIRPARSNACGHAVFELRKKSLTTPEAIAMFARTIGARAGEVDYAGLKDRHAATSQHVSVCWKGGAMPDAELAGAGWSARLVGWADRPISASWIGRNAFRIVVRGLSAGESDEMERRAGLLGVGESRELVVVNYFGDQRFGSARHGHGFAAKHLVRGEFEEALKLLIATPARKDSGKLREFTRLAAGQWGDWSSLVEALPNLPQKRAVEVLAREWKAVEGQPEGRRREVFRDAFAALPNAVQVLCVEAYQSHLWNSMARVLAEGAGSEVLRAEDEFGEMVFPIGVSEAARAVELPMPAPEVAPAEPWREVLRRVMEREGLRLDQLRVPGLRRPTFGSVMRAMYVRAERFELRTPERDELASPRSPKNIKRVAAFELPRGAYATVVLRALGQ